MDRPGATCIVDEEELLHLRAGGDFPLCGVFLAHPSVPPVSFSPVLSQLLSFSSSSPYPLLLLVAILFILTGLALDLRSPGMWEDSGSMPTSLPKHSLLLSIH